MVFSADETNTNNNSNSSVVAEQAPEKEKKWQMVSSKGLRTKLKVPRLLNGKTYMFRVRAENKFGVSDALESEPAVAQHSFDVPSKQSPPTVTDIIESACTVTWAEPESDGGSPIIGYTIERMDYETGKWSRCNHEPIFGLSMRVKGLFEGRQYQFRTYSENAAGVSKTSEPSKLFMASKPLSPPAEPLNIKCDDFGKDFISISWTKPFKDGGRSILGYFVEIKQAATDADAEWKRVNANKICLTTYIRIPGLKESFKYKLRVIAVTDYAESSPAELSTVIECKDLVAEPEIDVQTLNSPRQSARAGGIIKIGAIIRGRPTPEIKWTKKGQEIKSDRFQFNETQLGTEMKIKNASRSDSGDYQIEATNSAGSCSAKVIRYFLYFSI